MPGRVEHLGHGPRLHGPPRVHHRHPVRDLPHHREVVRHQQIGGPQLPLEPQQQIQDLGLHGHVQRGHRFVEQQQRGLDGEGPRDGDPLPLPPEN